MHRPEVSPKLSQSAISLLRDRIARINDLKNKASQLWGEEGDLERRRALLRERCKLIAGLADEVIALNDHSFPDEEVRFLVELATDAQSYLDSNMTFGIGTIGIPRGSRKGDLNEIELMIQRLE